MPTINHLGCPLSYSLRGQGPPVLFIQGVGRHGAGWNPQITPLSQHFTCLSFDNRGIGQSQPIGSAPISIPQLTQDALAIMDSLPDFSSTHLVGHSLDGLIALHIALTAPRRVRSLSLLCTFARGHDATRLTLKMLWIGSRTRIGTRRARRHAFLQLVMPPRALANADRDALAASLAPLFGHDLADQPPIVSAQLAALKTYDATSHLPQLASIPALVISAQHDPIARPILGRSLAQAIPGARYIEIPNASHGVVIHDAAQINSLLLDHITAAQAAHRST